MVFKLCIVITTEQPLEDCLLNLLVVFLFKEVIMEKPDRRKDKQLSALCTLVKSSDRSIRRETDWTTRHYGYGRSTDIQSGAIWINELETAILISFNQIILVDCVSLGVLASLLVGLLRLALSDSDEFFVEYTVSNEGLLWVQVLVEVLPDD